MAKIGILTGGGDCPGLNPVIRAVVRKGSREGFDVIGIKFCQTAFGLDFGKFCHGFVFGFWIGEDFVEHLFADAHDCG